MSEQEKPLTEAEKQIRRLQALRQGREDVTQASVERSNFPSKTQAQKSDGNDKLTAMRDQAWESPPPRNAAFQNRRETKKLETHLYSNPPLGK